MLDSVSVPELVDRMQLVVLVPGTQVRLLQHERWAVPLKDQVASVLVTDLQVALSSKSVEGALEPGTCRHSVRLKVDILRFEARPKESALISANWQLSHEGTGSPTVWSATLREPLPDDSADTTVTAWSDILRDLSNQIAGSACRSSQAD
jgi:uncharacterized lipoprotein YmbA